MTVERTQAENGGNYTQKPYKLVSSICKDLSNSEDPLEKALKTVDGTAIKTEHIGRYHRKT